MSNPYLQSYTNKSPSYQSIKTHPNFDYQKSQQNFDKKNSKVNKVNKYLSNYSFKNQNVEKPMNEKDIEEMMNVLSLNPNYFDNKGNLHNNAKSVKVQYPLSTNQAIYSNNVNNVHNVNNIMNIDNVQLNNLNPNNTNNISNVNQYRMYSSKSINNNNMYFNNHLQSTGYSMVPTHSIYGQIPVFNNNYFVSNNSNINNNINQSIPYSHSISTHIDNTNTNSIINNNISNDNFQNKSNSIYNNNLIGSYPIKYDNYHLTSDSLSITSDSNNNNIISNSSVNITKIIRSCSDLKTSRRIEAIEKLNPQEFYEFALSNEGKKFIINIYKDIENDTNDDTAGLNKKGVEFSSVIHEKILNYFYFFLIHENTSCVLVKILKFLSKLQRNKLWKLIKKANFIKLASFLSSSTVLINLINTIYDKSEEEIITRIITSKYSLIEDQQPQQKVSEKSMTILQKLKIESIKEKEDSNTANFESNLWYLATSSVHSVTVLQVIVGRFSEFGVAPYTNFIFNNFSRLIKSETAILLVLKYIRFLRDEQSTIRNQVYCLVINNLESLLLQNKGIDLLVQILEDWGYKYMKKLIKESYKINSSNKDATIEARIAKLFFAFIINKNKVSK